MSAAIKVTALDPETGESQTVELAPGQYVVTCADPAYVYHETAYRNGTSVVTIKKRAAAGAA
jgi:hypothetical protein